MGCAASTSVQQPQSLPGTDPALSMAARKGAVDSVEQHGQQACVAPQAVGFAKSLAACSLETAAEEVDGAARILAARSGSIHGLSDVKGVLREDIEARIAAAAQLRDKWMTSVGESAEDMTADVDVVLDGVEKLVGMFCSASSAQGAPPVDIQSLELSKRTQLEQGFAKYSALGQVLVDVALPAMEAMPFGAPVAAVIGAVYARAAQAARLSKNCERLLLLVKDVDAQLARVLDSMVHKQTKPPTSVEGALLKLTAQVAQCGRLMQDYAQRGFVLRFILSKGDAKRFEEMDTGIHRAMEWTAFCVSMDLLASPGSYQPDEPAGLRAAVCAAAGLPEERAEEAMQQLSMNEPGVLSKLVQQHGKFSEQVLNAELAAVMERVGVLEVEIKEVRTSLAQIKDQLARAATRQEEYTQLAGYLRDWWTQALGKRARSAPLDTFFAKLIQWFKDNNLLDQLLEYEEEMKKEGLSESLLAASKKICVEEGGQVLNFLSLIVIPLLDVNQDDFVDRTELLGLQRTAEEFAKAVGDSIPTSINDLLDVIFVGCDMKTILERAAQATNAPEIDTITEKLQAQRIIQSYSVSVLLESYVPGTRHWLFDRVNNWLDVALKASEAEAAVRSRMFLLLAGPGMGKSVFSAVVEKRLVVHSYLGRTVQVHHFFKVGEQRAQGKAMVLCLAQQLADQLPRAAKLLEPVAKEHGNAAALSMKEAFTKYLLEPLTALDHEQQQQGLEKLVVIILLDALDEASDGSVGFEPVAALIAREFIKLPAWVKLIVTGRPQTEPLFVAWVPEWIEPGDKDNQVDMRVMLESRLQQGGYVAAADVQAAVQVMLEKSQGQFIWAKYAFDELSAKEGLWTPPDIEDALPMGLYGVYRHILGTLQGALHEERPDLLQTLGEKLLPALVAASKPLSPAELAALTGANLEKIEELLRLLPNLFPMRLDGKSGIHKVFPYHKSVLDWLVDANGGWCLDVGLGHAIIGHACFQSITAAAAHAVADACGGGSGHAGPVLLGSSGGGSRSSSSGCEDVLSYTLRYGVAHLCAAGLTAELEELILDVVCFWSSAYAAGFGPEVARDLMALGPISSSPVVKDVLRWLRMVGSRLNKYPEATLQLACDAPAKSIVSQHANGLQMKPLAKLLKKEESWSPLLSTLSGHDSYVMGVAMAGSTIVSTSAKGSVWVWDLDTGECMNTLEGHSDKVWSVDISPDGSTCVSGSFDGTVRVWDLATGQCRNILEGNSGKVYGVAISADASTCVSCHGNATVRVWDLATGECRTTLEGHSKMVTSVAISADGETCLSGSYDETVRVWDVATGKCRLTLNKHLWDPVCSVAISQDGSTGVSGSKEGDIRVWDLATGDCRMRLQEHIHNEVSGLAISQDGSTLVSCSNDKTVRVWNLATGECRKTMTGHSDYVYCVAISKDNLTCVSGSNDKTVRIWDLATKECQNTLEGHSRSLCNIVVSADGSICLSSSGDSTIRVWDLATGGCLRILEGHALFIPGLAISADGLTCVSASWDCTVRVWDVTSGVCRFVLKGHRDSVSCVAITADCSIGVSGGGENDPLRVWDLATGKCRKTLEGHTGLVRCLVISKDGLTCASGAHDNTLRVWDLASGECRRIIELCDWPERVAISADGSMCVSASADKTVRMWDVAQAKELSCYSADSPEGQQQLDLAAKWNAIHDAPGPGQEQCVWSSDDNAVIYWDGCSSKRDEAGSMHQPAAYLLPHHIPQKLYDTKLMFNTAHHTVSFFNENNQLICLSLATPH